MTKKKCMSEMEWVHVDDPRQMLTFLRECKRVRCHVSDRKLRLFGCACCYRLWNLITEERDREAVRVTERFADGLASKPARAAAEREAGDTLLEAIHLSEAERDWHDWVTVHVTRAIWAISRHEVDAEVAAGHASGAVVCAERAATETLRPIAFWEGLNPPPPSPKGQEEVRWQCAILRDLFTPFRSPPAVAPAWLRWNHGTVPRLAQQIYDRRRFGDLPVLADALEEAGCADAGLLDHCRQPAEHARGCWVLDLLLAKE